uniref:Synaptojanin-2-binding protein-like n=1 Tax=Phallusia mammillata TaxID=59560 RepID=A0A6F9DUA7_9ASCI|nr:synaptojanin-2-binding protein-like [Phallusia mammillata]
MSTSEREYNSFQLHRGPNGLGFNIRGGKDQPHLPNDKGIFVTKVRENGSAAQDGRLKEGDKIIEINNNSLLDVNHSEAVDLFINAGENVALKVWHGAEKILIEEYTEKTKPKGTGFATVVFVIGLGVAIAAAYYYVKKRR